jgi:nucleotide-binding universal stress UspA family protein
MISLARILFPVDFSSRCRGAAHLVRAVARHFQAEVRTLHVMEAVIGGQVGQLTKAQLEIDRLAERELDGCKVVSSITVGDPAGIIIEAAHRRDIDLIIMPTHGHGPFRRFLLGVTTKVLHDVDCPVWTSTHLEDWPEVARMNMRQILCGVDLGPQSCAALKWASQLALEFRAKLTVVHPVPSTDAFGEAHQATACRDRIIDSVQDEIRNVPGAAGVLARVEVLDGAPASALSEMAERIDADLMVIGYSRPSLGPATGVCAIVAHSPCPVLLSV